LIAIVICELVVIPVGALGFKAGVHYFDYCHPLNFHLHFVFATSMHITCVNTHMLCYCILCSCRFSSQRGWLWSAFKPVSDHSEMGLIYSDST